MPNEISSEQILINRIMQTLPEVKEKKTHTIKNGESLWKIAKNEIGNKKATNKEIRDYVLLIAKLNNMDTLEKMNNIRVAENIFIPATASKENFKQKPIERTPFEKTLDDVIDHLINDKTVKIRKSNNLSGNLYHIFREKQYDSGLYSMESPLLSFETDEKGKPDIIMFDDLENFLHTGYDYEISKDGVVSINKYPHTVVQKLSKKDQAALIKQLEIQLEKYKQNPKPYYM